MASQSKCWQSVWILNVLQFSRVAAFSLTLRTAKATIPLHISPLHSIRLFISIIFFNSIFFLLFQWIKPKFRPSVCVALSRTPSLRFFSINLWYIPLHSSLTVTWNVDCLIFFYNFVCYRCSTHICHRINQIEKNETAFFLHHSAIVVNMPLMLVQW